MGTGIQIWKCIKIPWISSNSYKNEQAIADVIKWYGGKEKAVEAVLDSIPTKEELTEYQNDNAENYEIVFQLDNARDMLLDLAKEYIQYEKLEEATDSLYGNGYSKYVAQAIQRYYGV